MLKVKRVKKVKITSAYLAKDDNVIGHAARHAKPILKFSISTLLFSLNLSVA
jgi:hypothetical protein